MQNAGDDMKRSAAMFREVENRLIWTLAFLARSVTGTRMTSQNAKLADEALAEYQTRFPAIPPEGPAI